MRAFTNGKNINPQWSPDSRSLLLHLRSRRHPEPVSRAGRHAATSRQVTQRRAPASAASPASSPALSVASGTGIAAFSVYDDGKYDIYTSTVEPVGRRSAACRSGRRRPTNAATLPPLDREPSDVAGAARRTRRSACPSGADDLRGEHVQAEADARRRRRSRRSRVGAEPVRRGGRRRHRRSSSATCSAITVLATAVQLNSGIGGNFSLQEHGGAGAVLQPGAPLELGHRRRPDAVSERRIPERRRHGRRRAGRRSIRRSSSGRPNGAPPRLVAYPFNRAQRVEFQGGATRISFDQIVETQAFSLSTGAAARSTTRNETSLAAPLTLGTASAALVFDTSNFGATSPVQGQRYRLEASPTFGSMQLHQRARRLPPLLHAGAVLHDSPRRVHALRPLRQRRRGPAAASRCSSAIRTLVRGYDVDSFEAARLRAERGQLVPGVRSADRQPAAGRQPRVPLPAAAAVRRVPAACTDRCRWRSRCSPTAASRGTAATTPCGLRRRSAQRRGERRRRAPRRTCSASRSASSTSRARSSAPARGWIFQFNLTPGF